MSFKNTLLTGVVRHRLQQEIGQLALAHHAPTFSPHLTLLGGITNHPEEVLLKRTEEVANQIKVTFLK